MNNIEKFLRQGYNHPDKSFCAFTGQQHKKVAKALNKENWDWTPCKTINIEPWYWNTHTVALAFGCKPIFTSEGKEWIEKLITDASQVYNIEIPDVYSGRTGEILYKIKQIIDEYPEEVMVRMPDIQSPLGVAELIWDQSFYIALLTNPDEIHHLLNKIMRFTINYIKEMRKIAGERLNPACHPQVWSDHSGFYISDDVNSMVSPEMHKTFSIDYLNEMIDELGPVIYHSCTWTEDYLENMKKIKNIKSFNWSFGTSMDPALIMQEFGGKAMMVPHIGIGVHEEEGIKKLRKNIKSEYDLTKYMLDNQPDNTALYIWFQPELCEDVKQMKKIYGLMEDRGFKAV